MKYRSTTFKGGAVCLLYVFVLFLTSCEESLGPSLRISEIKREVPDCPPFKLLYQKVDDIPGVKISSLQDIRLFLQGKAFKAVLLVSHLNKLSLYMVSTQPQGLFRIWKEDDLFDFIRTNWKTRLGKDGKINFSQYFSFSLNISPDGKFVSYELFVKNPKSGEGVQMVWMSDLASVNHGWQYHLNSSHSGALGLRFNKLLWQGTVVAPYLVFQRDFNKIFFYYSLQPPGNGSLTPMSKIQGSFYLERIFSRYQVSGDSNIVVEPYGKMVDYSRKAEGEPYILEIKYSPVALARYPRNARNHDHVMIFNTEALFNPGLYPAHLEGHFLIVNKHREIQWQFQPADSLTNHQMSWTNHPNFVACKSSVDGWTTEMKVMLPGYNPETFHHFIIRLDTADSTLPYTQITAPLTSGKELIWLTGMQNIGLEKFPVEGRVEAVDIWIDNGK